MLYLATGSGMLKFDTQQGIYASAPAMESDGDKGRKKAVRELRVLDMKDRKDAFGNDVYAILHTQKGLLVGSLSGLRLNQRQILLTPGAQPLVNALAYDAKRHCYWIGTEGALYCADQALQNFSKIAALDGNSVKCLDEDQDGNLYIGTDNGLYRMAMNNSLEHFVHDSRNGATIPNITLRTTLIAGFPGETEEQYSELCDFVKTVKFDRLGCFAYSAEENTVAAKMDNQIDEEVKQRRADHIMELQAEISAEKEAEKVGKTYECICDGVDDETGMYLLRSAADCPEIDGSIMTPADTPLEAGAFYNVTITDADTYDLYGYAESKVEE